MILVAHCLPCRERERQLRSSAFPNQTDNLSLRCFSRKSKNHCILFPVRLVPSLLHHGGRWSLVCFQIPEPTTIIYSDLPLAHIVCPAVPFKTAPELECFLPNVSSTVCFPIRRALLRLVPNQTDNLSLRCFSRKSNNHCILFAVRLVPSLLHHGGRWSLVCFQIPEPTTIIYIVIWLLPTYDAQLCLSRLHQNLSAFCQMSQSQYASPSAECC